MPDMTPKREKELRIIDGCPSCGWNTLFIGKGGWLTCSEVRCQQPSVSRAVNALKDALDAERKMLAEQAKEIERLAEENAAIHKDYEDRYCDD